MRIVRFDLQDGTGPCVGVLSDSGSIHAVHGDLLGEFEVAGEIAHFDDVSLLAPCEPSKIVCVAINFPGIDGFDEAMLEPLVFIKPSTSIARPGQVIRSPFPDLRWWGESELGVVMRRRVGPDSPCEVMDAVLGFTIGNDTTVENVDNRDHHLGRSKAPDGFCALGPWIETELDSSDVLVEAIQDGEVIRRGRTSDQVWQWPQILREVTKWMTLEPWDVVLTGNPPDTVGMRYLGRRADYTARVQGIGELSNRFES